MEPLDIWVLDGKNPGAVSDIYSTLRPYTLERTAKVPLFYIPGNHDIGYSAVHSRVPEVIRRYEKVFGERNYLSKVGKVDFIAVDAQTLDGPSSPPRILLTHIPLYRPDWTLCGPHRSSAIINQVSKLYNRRKNKRLTGYYQTRTRMSAHDHDQCTVTHTSKHGPVKEHTLGTISWQQGNLYPSFILLSATNLTSPNASNVEEAILSQLCFLPVQTYLCLFLLSLLAILLWPTSGVGVFPLIGDFIGCIRGAFNIDIFRSAVKEKIEDENFVYEEVWDAEGSMHLIKKTLMAPIINSSESGSVEKGNAVMRSTAKKPVSQGTEFSIPLEVNVLGILDAGTKAAPARRSNKSTTRVVIQRVLRTFRVLTVVAAVNIPLYMMLLFKDWIDK
ncbi:hypothetical protein RJ639_043903 [Escallonia herrerae]|uniref:Calcineurin-like phosphoesterase domain-containing protein n=1 Tax=Escallonia herrerae TaxID=1293975 RepID=A0AA88WCD3_9ASTE|nr:hypothetical protein RJ639_043903 [Escallonia herrerae]